MPHIVAIVPLTTADGFHFIPPYHTTSRASLQYEECEQPGGDPLPASLRFRFEKEIETGKKQHLPHAEAGKKGGSVKKDGFDPQEAMRKDYVNCGRMPPHTDACNKDKEKDININKNKNKEKDTKETTGLIPKRRCVKKM